MGDLLCAIHQPNLFPRLSTLAKLYTADIWIVLDNVQFARRDYQHRCYLAPAGGSPLPERWLTVPVHLPDGVICQAGHRITALTDLAAAGRESLAAQLGAHALAWKSSPCQFLRRPVKAPA